MQVCFWVSNLWSCLFLSKYSAAFWIASLVLIVPGFALLFKTGTVIYAEYEERSDPSAVVIEGRVSCVKWYRESQVFNCWNSYPFEKLSFPHVRNEQKWLPSTCAGSEPSPDTDSHDFYVYMYLYVSRTV